jgi:protein-disulfide isomerase
MSRRLAALAPTRGALLVALVLGLGGVVLSLALARLHADAHAGVASFCAISDTVNCDKVATSPYSVFLGLPVAVWGIFGFGLAAGLAGRGLAGRRPHAGFPRGLLFLVAAAATAASVALALVSKTLIGAWCILCAAGWVTSVGLLGTAAAACRPAGVASAIRADLRAVRAMPGSTAALALLGLAAVALAVAGYPRYWERRPSAAAALAAPGTAGATGGPPTAAPPSAPAPAGAANPGPGVVVEYSDYDCPFCARAHVQTKALLARYPQWRLVRRHFPLDPSCNPAVKRAIHPGACDLARAGICAGEQGRFAEMDDALFATQRARVPAPEMARGLGLDVARFEACLASADTGRAIARDAEAGMRDGVRATPTYLVGGEERAVVVSGELPETLLGPPQGRATP